MRGCSLLLWLNKTRDTYTFPSCYRFLTSDCVLEKDQHLTLTAALLAQAAGFKAFQGYLQPPLEWTLGCVVCWLLFWIGIHSQPDVHLLLSHCGLEILSKTSHLWMNCESVEVLMLSYNAGAGEAAFNDCPEVVCHALLTVSLATFLLLPPLISISSSSLFQTAGVPAYRSSCISHSNCITLSFPR